MSDATTEALERIRAIAARAARPAAGEAIAPDPLAARRSPADAKPERGAPPLHWQEEAEERALEVRQVALAAPASSP